MAGGPPEYPGGDQVHDETRPAGEQHDAALHLRNVPKAVVRLVEDPSGDDPQAEGVEHGGQHFGAVVAECAFDGGRAIGNPHGEEGQADGGGVG